MCEPWFPMTDVVIKAIWSLIRPRHLLHNFYNARSGWQVIFWHFEEQNSYILVCWSMEEDYFNFLCYKSMQEHNSNLLYCRSTSISVHRIFHQYFTMYLHNGCKSMIDCIIIISQPGKMGIVQQKYVYLSCPCICLFVYCFICQSIKQSWS